MTSKSNVISYFCKTNNFDELTVPFRIMTLSNHKFNAENGNLTKVRLGQISQNENKLIIKI